MSEQVFAFLSYNAAVLRLVYAIPISPVLGASHYERRGPETHSQPGRARRGAESSIFYVAELCCVTEDLQRGAHCVQVEAGASRPVRLSVRLPRGSHGPRGWGWGVGVGGEGAGREGRQGGGRALHHAGSVADQGQTLGVFLALSRLW